MVKTTREKRAIKLIDTVGTAAKWCKAVMNTFKLQVRRFLIPGTAFNQKQEGEKS